MLIYCFVWQSPLTRPSRTPPSIHFSMNNVAQLMADGKIMVSHCKPHISCSAQFCRRLFCDFQGPSCLKHTCTCTCTRPGGRVIFSVTHSDLTQSYIHKNHTCWALRGGKQLIAPDWTGFVGFFCCLNPAVRMLVFKMRFNKCQWTLQPSSLSVWSAV